MSNLVERLQTGPTSSLYDSAIKSEAADRIKKLEDGYKILAKWGDFQVLNRPVSDFAKKILKEVSDGK